MSTPASTLASNAEKAHVEAIEGLPGVPAPPSGADERARAAGGAADQAGRGRLLAARSALWRGLGDPDSCPHSFFAAIAAEGTLLHRVCIDCGQRSAP